MIPIIVVAVIGVGLSIWTAIDDFHPPTALGFGLFITAVAILITFAITEAFYSRAAFASRTACMAKRKQPVRQALTTNVVCVPAYRETKNDTTTVNLNTK